LLSNEIGIHPVDADNALYQLELLVS